jgi:hypothetical protein
MLPDRVGNRWFAMPWLRFRRAFKAVPVMPSES